MKPRIVTTSRKEIQSTLHSNSKRRTHFAKVSGEVKGEGGKKGGKKNQRLEERNS